MPTARLPIAGLGAAAVLLVTVGLAAGARADALPRADGGRTPVRIHGDGPGCRPTLVVSHGLGGSETGFAAAARGVASAGWRVIVMGHPESGPPLLRRALVSGDLRGRLIAGASDPALHRFRFADLDAALKEAMRPCRPPRLVLAGHSMGAATTMLEAGATARFGRLGADRFDAYVAISPQGVGFLWEAGAWAGVRKPVLMITGTNDQAADGDYRTRLSAWRGLPPGPHRLAIIDGAGHIELAATRQRIGATVATLILDFLEGRPSRIDGVQVSPQ